MLKQRDPQRLAAIRRMVRRGASDTQIAAALGVSVKHAERLRLLAGVAQRPSVRPYTDAEKATLKAMLDNGATYTAVAEATGRSDRHLRTLFPGYGTGHTYRNQDLVATVVKMTAAGASLPVIAERIGRCERLVSRIRADTGISQPRAPYVHLGELAAMAYMISEGYPYAEIARTLKRSECTVRRWFPGHGLTPSQTAQITHAARRAGL